MSRMTAVEMSAAILLVAAGPAYGGQEQQAAPRPGAVAQANNAAVNEIIASLRPYSQEVPALQRRNPRYQIERSDTLSINFTFTPEYNETVTVQPDGFINLVGLPDMHVEGQTTPELTETLRAAYSKILHDPILTVTLTSFEKPYFAAFGMVTKPGKYELRGDTTVTQGVALAGGFTDREAKDSQVLLFRRVSNDWVEARKINVKRMLRAGDLSEDLHLQPGDMLFVPKSRISKIEPFLPYLIPLQAFRIGIGFNGGNLYD